LTVAAGQQERLVPIAEEKLTGAVLGTLVAPTSGSDLGVLVLHGSSGRQDLERARLFANQGGLSLALQWFGGEDQAPGICEVPLETFFTAVDYLKRTGCDRIALIGTSKGAEAALLTAVHDHRIGTVIAVSPSHVVWGNVGPGRDGEVWPQRSSWTLNGNALPFVASDPYWRRETRDGLMSYRSLYEQSLRRFAIEAEAATIPVEQIDADVLLVAGGDDALWPSEASARAIAARRAEASRPTSLVFNPDAGHRVLLPGETKPRSSLHAHGGSNEADAALGRAAWDQIVQMLRFGTPPSSNEPR
jgi:dienelactone hydrolase